MKPLLILAATLALTVPTAAHATDCDCDEKASRGDARTAQGQHG